MVPKVYLKRGKGVRGKLTLENKLGPNKRVKAKIKVPPGLEERVSYFEDTIVGSSWHCVLICHPHFVGSQEKFHI